MTDNLALSADVDVFNEAFSTDSTVEQFEPAYAVVSHLNSQPSAQCGPALIPADSQTLTFVPVAGPIT